MNVSEINDPRRWNEEDEQLEDVPAREVLRGCFLPTTAIANVTLPRLGVAPDITWWGGGDIEYWQGEPVAPKTLFTHSTVGGVVKPRSVHIEYPALHKTATLQVQRYADIVPDISAVRPGRLGSSDEIIRRVLKTAKEVADRITGHVVSKGRKESHRTAVADHLKVLRFHLEHSQLDDQELSRLVTRMVAVVPRRSPWPDQIGPVYTTEGLAEVLGLEPTEVELMRIKRLVLALHTEEGDWLYPAAQLSSAPDVIAGLGDLISLFEPGSIDDYTLASWLLTPRSVFDGLSAVQWLEQRGLDTHIKTVVRDIARRFAA